MSLISSKVKTSPPTFGELVENKSVTIYSYFISDNNNIIPRVYYEAVIEETTIGRVVIKTKDGKELASGFSNGTMTFDGFYTYFSTYELTDNEKENILIAFSENHCI